MGSNSSVPTVSLSGQEQLLQNRVRGTTSGQPHCASSLHNSSLINNILGTIGGGSSVDSNNVIILNATTSHNIPEGAEGQAVSAAVLLENGDNSDVSPTAVSMERSGVAAVSTSVRGVFVKSEPLDSGAGSGGVATVSGITGSSGE